MENGLLKVLWIMVTRWRMAEGVVEWMMREGNEFAFIWIFILKERKEIYRNWSGFELLEWRK